MKKVVLWLWVAMFVIVKYLYDAVCWTYREMVTDFEPFIDAVTFAQAVAFLSASVCGFGLLGVLLAVMRKART